MKFKFALIGFIALFSANFGYGQNTLDNIGLTSSTPASVAFSLRQLSTSYTGPLVRIKVGTSFYDVYPDASTKNFSLSSKISAVVSTYNAGVSVASTNALSTIISGSTDATVAIWYDQSGNGTNVLTNSSLGPKIINQGSILLMYGKPTVYFAGAISNSVPLVSSATVNYSSQQTATINAVAQNIGSTSNISGIYSTGLSGGWGLNYDPTASAPGYWLDGSGCNQAFSGTTSTTPKIIIGFLNKTTNSSIIYENSVLKGTKTMTCNIDNGIADKICIGVRAENGGSRKFDGNISEVILFPSILSNSNQTLLETNQNTTYFSPFVTITSSASSNTICNGTNVTFTANAQNFSGTPTYQWYKNGVAISGATSSTYSSTSLSNNDQISATAYPGYTSGSISTNGLIANFDAANYNSSSTRWNDLSPSSNHMDFYTSQNYSSLKTATYSTDGGGCLLLNDNSVYGKTINNTGITGNGGKTMSAWVKFDAADRDWTSIASIGAYNNYAVLFEIFGSRNGAGYQAMLVFAGGLVPGVSTIPINTWTYITIKADGSSLKLYVNGVLDATGNQTLSTTNSPLFLGAPVPYSNGGWNDNLRGRMSTLSLYNIAVNDQTILDNYNATKGRYATIAGYNSNSITTTVNLLPSASVTVNGDGCINKTTLSTTSGLTSYTWYKDNIAISGASSNTYIPTTAGDYKVQVSNGTCTNTSASTTMTACGLTAEGKLIPIENSTTLVSKDGATNSGKGIDERGLIITKPIYYGTVTTRTGRIWLDRNLGASRVALSPTDTQAYGDYYQWGRRTDGHEKQIARGVAGEYSTTKSATSVPPDGKFIFPSDGSFDWLITSDNTLWSGVNAPNNPCPAGFRIPTESEWAAEAAAFTTNNAAGSFEAGYGLKLTVGGMATSQNNLVAAGNYGQYLTQTAYDNGRVKYFGVISYVTWFDTNYYKTTGQSCRCIKD
jgi:uncharacterized protein (TIGR02145 family)